MTDLGKLIISNKIILILVVINLCSSLVAFYLAFTSRFPDSLTYWLMGEGIMNGRFSSWYFLDTFYPETIRTPGYPLFLALCRSLVDSEVFVKIIQFLLYLFSLLLALKLVVFLSKSKKRSLILFLILTGINLQIPFYSGYLSSDITSIFLTILFIYILITKKQNNLNAIFLGLVGGLLCMMRPSFLLFPFLLISYCIVFRRSPIRYNLVHTIVFVISLLPFSVWNYNNHGVFKPTPIEGAASIAHMGYWNFKLPIDYREDFQYKASVVKDLTNPVIVPTEEREKNKIIYESKWKKLNDSLEYLQSEDDVENIKFMKSNKNPGIFPLYNSQYTIAREQGLFNLLIQEVKENPFFYAKTRIYTFFRVYFTGIDKRAFEKDRTVINFIKSSYPFIVTFCCIFLGLLFCIGFFIKKRGNIPKGLDFLLLMSIYYGFVYMPFAAQGRYTVPIHFCILIYLSIALSGLHNKQYIKR